MSVFDEVLHWGPVWRVRRNHALEHATLQVMAERNPSIRAAGYSDAGGFWLMGDLDTAEIEQGVTLALARLHNGEQSLAIHPHCGTNLVTSSFLAGSLGFMGMLGAGRSWRDRMERWPLVITLVTLGLVLAQPLGPFLQARVTTSPSAEGVRVVRVERRQRGDMPIHRVVTRY